MFKLYALYNTDQIDTTAIKYCMRYLPENRLDKALKYRKKEDRNNCVLSYLMVLYALYINYGIRDSIFAYGKKGKPFLENYPDIHFSISHCSKGGICGISNTQIGVDIQEIRPYSNAIAERCCSTNELDLLKQSKNAAEEFTRMWTMKESYLKMYGCGITTNLAAVDTTKLTDRIQIHKNNGCYISVANAEKIREESICLD